MARKKGGGHGGGHGWFVTFADLMGLLMSFFVMLTAFSTQDQKKLQMVAGSMRDAFGTQKASKLSGVVELDGLPVRPHLRHVERVSTDFASEVTAPRDKTKSPDPQRDFLMDRSVAMAAASLRQAMQDLPEVAEASKNVLVEETSEGLDLQIVDQDGRAMFGEGEATPLPRTARLLERLADRLARLPNPIKITGHASGGRSATREADAWRISAERALAVRAALERGGIAPDRFQSVTGKGASEPMFPDDPRLAANRRVSIVIVKMAPPLPR
ncbi:MAG: flagellar motor protein MotB [Proteobacteria bacterium]|nr:flagellar motor protein MotB [Pseudomonadota bacterium]